MDGWSGMETTVAATETMFVENYAVMFYTALVHALPIGKYMHFYHSHFSRFRVDFCTALRVYLHNGHHTGNLM